MLNILTLINNLCQTDKYIETIYLNGACYKFHLFLKMLYPESKPYINKEKNHVITKYKCKFYDITGEVSGNLYVPLINRHDIDMVSKWSFYKNKSIQINKCPFCGEPILV